MAFKKTPGVYVEEIPVLPPAVAEVATAIPAFIGYTEKQESEPQRISNMLEYQTIFGGAPTEGFTAKITRDSKDPKLSITGIEVVRTSPSLEFLLYHSLSLYFRNGGGPCWVISVGTYAGSKKEKDAFNDQIGGLATLRTLDEPTLILLSDATTLTPGDYYDLCAQALAQCSNLMDRFTIIDVVADNSGGKDVDVARNWSSDYFKYGAAYYPYLNTLLNYPWTPQDVSIDDPDGTPASGKLSDIANTPLYALIKTKLNELRMTLPPSPAIAGIYARVDRDRGVWKTPANVSVAAVIGPVKRITDAEQEDLNVHDSGKSINVIREFTGKGTLVWGARTLAGNDNEWRYVSVRRLFNMIEESARKATAFAVFESNTASTWLKVRAMIESYLYGLWERGALAGPTPEAAYVVNVGLGKTMTVDDVLNGRLIVEIGVAPARPAEFIYLRFMHKLPEA